MNRAQFSIAIQKADKLKRKLKESNTKNATLITLIKINQIIKSKEIKEEILLETQKLIKAIEEKYVLKDLYFLKKWVEIKINSEGKKPTIAVKQ